MEIIKVIERTPLLLQQLLEIWEKSVKATHLFLTDVEIQNIKEYVPQALREIPHLIVGENENAVPIAFMGIDGQKLEMLFIAVEENFEVNELTVNEQNPLAKGFYEHLGFQVYKRTDSDEQGNPYPLLYMKLNCKIGI